MAIDYDHARNRHSARGPLTVIPKLRQHAAFASVLDVGCGIGTWLSAALKCGISDVFGLDGIDIPSDTLMVPVNLFRKQDLTKPWDLGRRYDLALCLEVAEHLDEAYAVTLIDSLTRHSDQIVFSAACPDQPGQHHVNCQWPSYWQAKFNDKGFACSDLIRWQIWEEESVEEWYRQNIFIARRDAALAGAEPRIKSVIHPALLARILEASHDIQFPKIVRKIECGVLPLRWYGGLPVRALMGKILRRFSNKSVMQS